MPIDLDYNGSDWLKRQKFVYTAGEVGIPRSDAETADELLAFLNVDDSDIETQQRHVRAYLSAWDVPEPAGQRGLFRPTRLPSASSTIA